MDISKLSKEVAKFIFPFLAKNKAVSKITEDIKEASNTSLIGLWNWIKPIFIEEFEDENGLDSDVENVSIVEREIKKKIQNVEFDDLKVLTNLINQLKDDAKKGKLPQKNAINLKGNQNIVVQDSADSVIHFNTQNKKNE